MLAEEIRLSGSVLVSVLGDGCWAMFSSAKFFYTRLGNLLIYGPGFVHGVAGNRQCIEEAFQRLTFFHFSFCSFMLK